MNVGVAYLAALRSAKNLLGGVGVMLSTTKSAPEGEVVLWNARVFAPRADIWAGDLNMTRSESGVIALAAELGVTVYVFPESARRLEYAPRPPLPKAAYRVTKDGEIWINERHLARDPDGRLRLPARDRLYRDSLTREGRLDNLRRGARDD